MRFDLNCDLGEGEPLARTRSLMRQITSANVACGGHAGDFNSMDLCVRFAKKYGVHLGAHPGAWQRDDFGRRAIPINGDQLELLLLHQVGALERIARRHDVRLHHIKLHGALYHQTESDEQLARRYVQSVRNWWPRAKIYALASGRVVRLAKRARVSVWEEAFVDRGYRTRTSLIPRDRPGALISSKRAALERVRSLEMKKSLVTISGDRVELHPQTLCIHSDTPGALQLAHAVRQALASL